MRRRILGVIVGVGVFIVGFYFGRVGTSEPPVTARSGVATAARSQSYLGGELQARAIAEAQNADESAGQYAPGAHGEKLHARKPMQVSLVLRRRGSYWDIAWCVHVQLQLRVLSYTTNPFVRNWCNHDQSTFPIVLYNAEAS